MQTKLVELTDAAKKRINGNRHARDCLAKLSHAGCDAVWITQALAILPIADEFVQVWRKISGRGSRKLKKSLDLIRKAVHEIFCIGQDLPLEIAHIFYRHPSVPMLDHTQGIGAKNLPWLLGEYRQLLLLLDRLAGQGHPEVPLETPGDRMFDVMRKLQDHGDTVHSVETAEKPASDGNARFKIAMRNGRIRYVTDKPPLPQAHPYAWPKFPDLIKWAIVDHVKQKTGKYFDAEISFLIAVVMEIQDYKYDESVHRVWRRRNQNRLQKTFQFIGLLPGTEPIFGHILKM